MLTTSIALLAGCSDNTKGTGTTIPTTPTTPAAATLQLSASPAATVKSDNSNTATITVTALDAPNVVVSGTAVNVSTNTGELSKGSVITDATGKATLTLLPLT